MSPRSSTVVFDASKIEEAIEKAVQAVSTNISYPEIPEELFEIFAYLPELFQDGDEERYIEALSLAMQTSYENGLYQFAYMQYHMLFMTAIYFVLLKLSTTLLVLIPIESAHLRNRSPFHSRYFWCSCGICSVTVEY